MAYTVQHLATGEKFTRPYIYHNNQATDLSNISTIDRQETDPSIEKFHQSLPIYNSTPLHILSSLATELGFKHIFLKDESTRFTLPSFKILGASWAIHRAICKHLQLPVSSSLTEVKAALRGQVGLRLVTCTEGNWGRACARMGALLGLEVKIFVPGFMNAFTKNLLSGEAADVVVLENGSYDDCIAALIKEAEGDPGKALMVMDTSWEGYEEIPQWVTEGYTTMLTETTRQVQETISSHEHSSTHDSDQLDYLAFVSVGVGSWAHAVTKYYKNLPNSKVIAVEPEAAPSLTESLHQSIITTVVTGETIMNGMNCGTTSRIAFPVLQSGVDGTVIVTDIEAHRGVLELRKLGVNAGPCGAATLAALRKFAAGMDQEERSGRCVVLFSTEGGREYEVPVEQNRSATTSS